MRFNASDILLWITTWPYFWTLRHFTVLPIRRVVGARLHQERFRLEVELFIRGKLHELKFVTLASTLAAAATLAAFSWSAIENSPWAVFGVWYFSLILAIFSLLNAGQQSALLHSIVVWKGDALMLLHPRDILRLVSVNIQFATEDEPAGREELRNSSELSSENIKGAKPSLMMMYVWQNPVMLMAWSVVTFVLGLIIHVTSPLRNDTSGVRDWRSAVFFLICGGLTALNFGWCSFWLYRFAKYSRDTEDWIESDLRESVDVTVRGHVGYLRGGDLEARDDESGGSHTCEGA